MKLLPLFLSALSLCSAFPLRAAVPLDKTLPPDTVYIVRESAPATEPARRTFRFYFDRERAEFDRYTPANAAELERMDNLFRSTRPGDTVVAVRRLTITGYCSVEGAYYNNEALSRRRAESLRDLVQYRYQGSAFTIDTRYRGEDWAGLRRLLETTEINYRHTMLDIIDHVDVLRGRERQLMQVGGGQPYREMQRSLFPRLRRVEVEVDYERRRPAPVQQAVVATRPVTTTSPCPEDDAARRREERLRRMDSFVPRIAVKTNLADWAGLTQDLDRTTFMPNLSLEVFLGSRWSLMATGRYANWAYDSDRQYWGESAYSVEPRFWFDSEGLYRGFYVGAFGLAGDFNNQSTDPDRVENGTANSTGDYWQVGLSAGYHLRFNEHWGLELGLRAGYREADVKTYAMPGYWYETTRKHTAFGLAGLNVSLVYRLGW